jgi:hypothetical protein
MVGIDAHRIESTRIVSITRVLTGSSNACFSQRAVIVARATHYIRATATRNMCTQEGEGDRIDIYVQEKTVLHKQ